MVFAACPAPLGLDDVHDASVRASALVQLVFLCMGVIVDAAGTWVKQTVCLPRAQLARVFRTGYDPVHVQVFRTDPRATVP